MFIADAGTAVLLQLRVSNLHYAVATDFCCRSSLRTVFGQTVNDDVKIVGTGYESSCVCLTKVLSRMSVL